MLMKIQAITQRQRWLESLHTPHIHWLTFTFMPDYVGVKGYDMKESRSTGQPSCHRGRTVNGWSRCHQCYLNKALQWWLNQCCYQELKSWQWTLRWQKKKKWFMSSRWIGELTKNGCNQLLYVEKRYWGGDWSTHGCIWDAWMMPRLNWITKSNQSSFKIMKVIFFLTAIKQLKKKWPKYIKTIEISKVVNWPLKILS